jgi:hypothetical protein
MLSERLVVSRNGRESKIRNEAECTPPAGEEDSNKYASLSVVGVTGTVITIGKQSRHVILMTFL